MRTAKQMLRDEIAMNEIYHFDAFDMLLGESMSLQEEEMFGENPAE